MYNITATVEKEDENGKLTLDAVRLTEIGGHSTHSYL